MRCGGSREEYWIWEIHQQIINFSPWSKEVSRYAYMLWKPLRIRQISCKSVIVASDICQRMYQYGYSYNPIFGSSMIVSRWIDHGLVFSNIQTTRYTESCKYFLENFYRNVGTTSLLYTPVNTLKDPCPRRIRAKKVKPSS